MGGGADGLGKLQNGVGLTRGDIVGPHHFWMKGGMEEGGGNVFDKDEVAGLESVAMDRKRRSFDSGLKKFRDGGGVGALRILAWSVDVKEAERDGGKG